MTGSGIYTSHVVPVELATGVVGSEIPISCEGTPQDVAITPDGKTAYVTGAANVVPINVATNTVGTPIQGVRPAPQHRDQTRRVQGLRGESLLRRCLGDRRGDGHRADKIAVGSFPNAIAVTPDGSKAYVSNGGEETVTPIDLATDTAGTPIEVGQSPQGIAVTPDGTRAYVAVHYEDAVKRIDVSTNAVGPAIRVAEFPDQIATTPDSSRAYVLAASQPVTPIDLPRTPPARRSRWTTSFLEDLAITPDGSRAWLTDDRSGQPARADRHSRQHARRADRRRRTTRRDRDRPQPAAARRLLLLPLAGPARRRRLLRRRRLHRLRRQSSPATCGTSATAATRSCGGPTPQHTYSFGGTYTVTLTTTDNEGCSLEIVFPGQTAFCNGAEVARTSHQVQVNPKCIEVTGSASSFVPKYRAARVVPGVRLRLAASAPARLTVDATLSWSRGGGGSFDLPTADHERPALAPGPLRDPGEPAREAAARPPVTLKLRIEAAPLDETLCPGKASKDPSPQGREGDPRLGPGRPRR